MKSSKLSRIALTETNWEDRWKQMAQIAGEIKRNLSGFTYMWPADYMNFLNKRSEDQLIADIEEAIALVRKYKELQQSMQ